MPNFDTGISSYIKTYAVVEVNFPVDERGRADISCYRCPFFYRNSSRCQLNEQLVAYPERFVGDKCPLMKKEE